MPCMDNDLTRRGKPTTHVAFGEWKALLTGDALLIASFAELERLKSSQAPFIRQLFHWATGAKGLILGQWIDLGHEADNAPALLMRMHELKTARLMQIACAGAWALQGPLSFAQLKKALRLGQAIGLAFQLLDDLDDLSTEKLSEHEKAVNPFIRSPKVALQRLKGATENLQRYQGAHTKTFLRAFLETSAKNVLSHESAWGAHVAVERKAIVELLTSDIYS